MSELRNYGNSALPTTLDNRKSRSFLSHYATCSTRTVNSCYTVTIYLQACQPHRTTNESLRTRWYRSLPAGITNTNWRYCRHVIVVSKRRKQLETVCEDVVHIQLAASCEHGTDKEPSGFMKGEEIRKIWVDIRRPGWTLLHRNR
jgi:hypothetical protein